MGKSKKTYRDEMNIKNEKRIQERLEKLPPFCTQFFRSLNDITSSNTRCGYAYDLDVFFTYLCNHEQDFINIISVEFKLEQLSMVTADHIENFMAYLTYYVKEEDGEISIYQNNERGKSRKLSSIRTMFSYFYKKRALIANPSELIGFPKTREKSIVRLEIDEVAKLLDEVETGEKLSGRQHAFHEINKTRDLAIVTLLLGTGMRVSECVGVDINDINLDVNGVRIMRKGGDQVIVYFGHEVRKALLNYLKERKMATAVEGHENALFLSLRNKRLTVRSVQNLVKKYSNKVTPLKNISPHKLRSTFGTNLYAESNDIYLVADVLGHKDVNTTKKYYAQMLDSRRRQAAKYIVLRKDE